MSGNEFENTVLVSLELILDALSNPSGLEKNYLEEIAKFKKNINDLELDLKKEKSNSFMLKAENDELSQDLKEAYSEIDKLKALIEDYEKKLDSMKLQEDESPLEKGDCRVPDRLVENSEFSLKLHLEDGKTKGKIIEIFKKFVITLSLETFDNDIQDVLDFLDEDSSLSNSPLFKSAQKEWGESLHFGTNLLEISEELEKVPAKNRYKNIIEKFEKMIS